jgi:cytochrome c oxidase assembly protein subunit 11
MSLTGRSKRPLTHAEKRNRRVGVICALGFAAMVGAAYASVPLYKAFCQVTGYDGTVRKADVAPTQVLGKTLNIRFDANVRDLPWDFAALQTNHSDKAITGRAVFNVTPEQAGAYFEKLSCFCFTDQTIQAGQTVEMPVLYFVDPKYADDPDTKGKGEVTLSYTFYPAVDAKPAAKVAAAKAGKAG